MNDEDCSEGEDTSVSSALLSLLPPDWHAVRSAQGIYYYNSAKHTTSWSPPPPPQPDLTTQIVHDGDADSDLLDIDGNSDILDESDPDADADSTVYTQSTLSHIGFVPAPLGAPDVHVEQSAAPTPDPLGRYNQDETAKPVTEWTFDCEKLKKGALKEKCKMLGVSDTEAHGGAPDALLRQPLALEVRRRLQAPARELQLSRDDIQGARVQDDLAGLRAQDSAHVNQPRHLAPPQHRADLLCERPRVGAGLLLDFGR